MASGCFDEEMTYGTQQEGLDRRSGKRPTSRPQETQNVRQFGHAGKPTEQEDEYFA
jgi:hypothetical protein